MTDAVKLAELVEEYLILELEYKLHLNQRQTERQKNSTVKVERKLNEARETLIEETKRVLGRPI